MPPRRSWPASCAAAAATAEFPERFHGSHHRRRLPEAHQQPVPSHPRRDLPRPPAATCGARQLSAGASPMVEPNRDKATVIALREIAAGKVGTEVLKKNPTPPASTL